MTHVIRLFCWLLLLGALALLSAPAGAAVTFTTLYNFTAINGSNENSDGANPYAGLVRGSDGDFYGTAISGGSSSSGTVFKITPSGTHTTLYSFTGGNDGQGPEATLVQGSDGDFYGTTNDGGMEGDGVVFKITPSGTLTTLYSFTGGNDGGFPLAGLVQGADGDFYGTTGSGGNSFEGTVFKITSSGTLTTLYSFGTTSTDGAFPFANLIQGSDGNFYGTTMSGGSSNDGTVFKFVTDGTAAGTTLTTLVSFDGTDGKGPQCTLLQTSDGNFYGTTMSGGSSNDGTVFKFVTDGTAAGTTLTTLVSFSGADESGPDAGLVLGNDGDLYGTTFGGGSSGSGTVFKITPAGALTTLYSFSATNGKGFNSDGEHPLGLVLGSDGSFYGTATDGGASGTGTVFAINDASPPSITSFTPTSGPIGTLVTLTGQDFSGTTAVRFHDASAATFSVNSAGTQITAVVPTGALTGTISVTTPGGAMHTATPFTVTAPAAPSITSFSPASGLTGTSVTITGPGVGAATSVAFGGIAATYTVNSPTQVTAVVPGTVPNGPAAITVTNASGTATGANDFTVTGGAPIPLTISPASGPAGTVLTITGMRLGGVTAVRFHDANATVFSASPDGKTITATVPPGALSGTLKITTPLGMTQTTASFTVTP